MSMVKDVDTFLNKFNLKYDGGPRRLPSKVRLERSRHMTEELTEYMKAESIEDEFDALIDLVYIAIGTARMQGLNFELGFIRVHQANMRKVKGGKDVFKGGVKKPNDWQKPYLKDLVDEDKDL